MEYTKPLPVLDVWNRPFWESCNQKILSMQQCIDCRNVFYPPGPVCPSCFSDTLQWKQLSGKGYIESWIVFHQRYFKGFADEIPYNVALIRLEEGTQFISNIVNVSNEDIYINMKVEVTFETVTEDITIPKFKPVAKQ